ncbi:SIS domain-containing protein [Cyclobacteriaceae bacterium]|nr:SIS domain-containing protein [Cyclobacteriaceae bacterium]
MESSRYYLNNGEVAPCLLFEKVQKSLKKLKKNNKNIYFFGNGASAAFANHMALDFSKNGGILSKSLSDSAMLTALSNDYSYEKAMLEYLKIEDVSKDDLVITISSSGNSPNILNVLRHCKENNIKTLALSGLKIDNNSISLADYSIYVPMKTYGMVECIHQIFLHLILDEFMEIYEWDRGDVQNMNASNFKL